MENKKLEKLRMELEEQVGSSQTDLMRDLLDSLEKQSVYTQGLIEKVDFTAITEKQRLWFKRLTKTVKGLKIEMPKQLEVIVKDPVKTVEVSNLDDIKLPREVEVTNLRDIKIPKLPKFPVPPKSVTIKNIKDIKFPKKMGIDKPEWFEQLTEKQMEAAFFKALVSIVNKGFKIDLDMYRDANKPLAVRLSDGKKFYNALFRTVEALGDSFPFVDSAGRNKGALVDSSGHVQVDVASGLKTTSTFNLNDLEETGASITYFGLESSSGVWYLMKFDDNTSPNTLQHATISNNATITSYSLGWTNRASLNYADYSDVF